MLGRESSGGVLRRHRRSTLTRVFLGAVIVPILFGSACRSDDSRGLPEGQRAEHLQVLERESRLNDVPVGAKQLKSFHRTTCQDTTVSDRTLMVGRDYEFLGLRSEVVAFHGSSLTSFGWVLAQDGNLESDFTSVAYTKSFDGWQGRVIIGFTGKTVSITAEDVSSPVC